MTRCYPCVFRRPFGKGWICSWWNIFVFPASHIYIHIYINAVTSVYSISSSSMALQPNFGLGLFSSLPPKISVLYWPSPVLAFQYPRSIFVHCVLPSSSGSSICSSLFLENIRGYSFVLHPRHITYPLEFMNLISLVSSISSYKFADYTCFSTVLCPSLVCRFL